MFGARGQMLRNCALMGMTAGLAAFFGVALGGMSEACLAPQCLALSLPALMAQQPCTSLFLSESRGHDSREGADLSLKILTVLQDPSLHWRSFTAQACSSMRWPHMQSPAALSACACSGL